MYILYLNTSKSRHYKPSQNPTKNKSAGCGDLHLLPVGSLVSHKWDLRSCVRRGGCNVAVKPLG